MTTSVSGVPSAMFTGENVAKRVSAHAALVAALVTLVVQLWICRFFAWGREIPLTSDFNLSNVQSLAFSFPPTGFFSLEYWLGMPNLPVNFTPVSFLALLPGWMFISAFYPLCAATAVLTMDFLLRELGFKPLVSVVISLVYAWQSSLMTNLFPGHFSPAALITFIPLSVGLTLKAFRQSDWLGTVLAGAVTGLMVALVPDRGGLCSLLPGMIGLGKIAWGGWGNLPRRLGKLAVIVAVAMLVAYPTLQSNFASNVEEVQKGAGGGDQAQYGWATQWSCAPEDFLSYVVPGMWGWHTGSEQGPYWGRIGRSPDWKPGAPGMKSFLLDAFGFGTIPLFLSFFGGWALVAKVPPGLFSQSQLRMGRFFALFGIVCLVLALGKYTPVYRLFYALPYMDTWRNPFKFLFPANFCLIVLSAYGLQRTLAPRLGSAESSGVAALAAYARGLGFGLLLVFGISRVGAPIIGVVLSTQGYADAQIAAITGNLSHCLFAAGLVLWGFGSGVRWYLAEPAAVPNANVNPVLRRLFAWSVEARNRPVALVLMLGALTMIQQFWVESHFIYPLRPDEALRANSLLDRLRHEYRLTRVKIQSDDAILHHLLSVHFPYWKISSIDIPAASRMPNAYVDFFAALEKSPARFYELAGVKYFAVQTRLLTEMAKKPGFFDGVQTVYYYQVFGPDLQHMDIRQVAKPEDSSYALLELKEYLPKALLVPNLEVMQDKSALLHRLADPSWNPRQSVMVSLDAIPTLPKTPGTGTPEKVSMTVVRQYDSKSIEVEAHTDRPEFLLINDYYDPHWRVTVNGEPAVLFRANFLMRAVPLPVGESVVRMEFQPSSTGVYLSMMIWPVLLIWAVRRRQV